MYFTRTGPRGRMEDVSFGAAEAISPEMVQHQLLSSQEVSALKASKLVKLFEV